MELPLTSSLSTPLSHLPQNTYSLTQPHLFLTSNPLQKSNISNFSKPKPYINFIPLPYCQDPSSTFKPLPRVRKPKNTSSFSWNTKYLSPLPLPPIQISLGETPINEYLDYVLTQEINVELRGAKILAQEVKRIKEQKRKQRREDKGEKENGKGEGEAKKGWKRGKNKLVGHSFLFKLK